MPRRQRIAKSGPITGLTKLTYVRPKLDYSFAYQAARHVLADWMPSHLSVDWASRGRPKQRPPGGLLEVFAPFFTARARDGVEVFLAAIPTLSESRTRQISRRADQARLWTRQFRNVHLIDVRRTLWPRIQPDDYIYFGDRHLNARAHDEIAAAIFDRLHPLLLALRQGERRTKLAGRSPWWRPSAAPPE